MDVDRDGVELGAPEEVRLVAGLDGSLTPCAQAMDVDIPTLKAAAATSIRMMTPRVLHRHGFRGPTLGRNRRSALAAATAVAWAVAAWAAQAAVPEHEMHAHPRQII